MQLHHCKQVTLYDSTKDMWMKNFKYKIADKIFQRALIESAIKEV